METPEQAYRRIHRRDGAVQKSPRRVHSLLRAAIYSGELAPNQRLSEDELVEALGTSRNAIREALVLLAKEGLVTRSTRVGTVVAGNIVTLTIEGFAAPSDRESGGTRYSKIESTIVPSTKLLRTKLDTDETELMMHEFVIQHGDEPFCLYTGYARVSAPPIPFASFDSAWTLEAAFASAYGVPLAHIETHVGAVLCEPRTARRLGVPEGSYALMRARLLADASGTCREYSYSYFVERNLVMHSSSTLVDGVWTRTGLADAADVAWPPGI
ncbi:GntR family transcriptional regulator [Microbacteriaceae bacterium VKM Ac-2855]|nr:GntR family transcriptional regulator [Microbacteriaceae bacterium VKM Ac-2855]